MPHHHTLNVMYLSDPYCSGAQHFPFCASVDITKVHGVMNKYLIYMVRNGIKHFFSDEERDNYENVFFDWCRAKDLPYHSEEYSPNKFFENGGNLSNAQIISFLTHSDLVRRFAYIKPMSNDVLMNMFVNRVVCDEDFSSILMGVQEDSCSTPIKISCICPNCGYNNPASLATCQLCNKEIESESNVYQ